MIRKILFSSIPILFLFNLFIVSTESITNIELLDIEQNKIITIPKIQLEAKKIINSNDTSQISFPRSPLDKISEQFLFGT